MLLVVPAVTGGSGSRLDYSEFPDLPRESTAPTRGVVSGINGLRPEFPGLANRELLGGEQRSFSFEQGTVLCPLRAHQAKNKVAGQL
jgi:hypothetical protein